MENFEVQLSGGHPNSLGNTIAVVDQVLGENKHFNELFNCYFSTDEVVRLRVSNAMKRIAKANLELLLPYTDRFLEEISGIDQASTQWTLAQLFLMLERHMTEVQRKQASDIMKHNLANHDDWIVLNQTMETLGRWAKKDAKLANWLLPHLERLASDPRKSVAKKAKKTQDAL